MIIMEIVNTRINLQKKNEMKIKCQWPLNGCWIQFKMESCIVITLSTITNIYANIVSMKLQNLHETHFATLSANIILIIHTPIKIESNILNESKF